MLPAFLPVGSIYFFLGIPILAELVAVPVAINFLTRGGYASPANIVMTAAAAFPLVIAVLLLLVVTFGRIHM